MGGVNGKPLIGYNKPAKKMAWWWYEFGLSLPSDLREKTYVITGTTTGTGRCAAMALAERSARVICLNRPSERAVESLEAIKLGEHFPGVGGVDEFIKCPHEHDHEYPDTE